MKLPLYFLAGVVAFALAGCASLVANVLHPALTDAKMTYWAVDIASAQGPYVATWVTHLVPEEDGAEEQSIMPSYKVPLHYKNWTFNVFTNNQDTRNKLATTDRLLYPSWHEAFSRLYGLTSYLLGAKPVKMLGDVILVEPNYRYNHRKRTESDSGIAISYGFYYGGVDQDAAAKFKQRREGLATLGYLYQHFALVRGVTKAPENTRARILKDEANSLCWNLAVRPALANGYAVDVKHAERLPLMSSTIRVLKSNYDNHPQSRAALKLYATALLFKDGQAYMDHAGQEWARSGSDKKSMNAALRFCRAFLQYHGDIEESVMPVEAADVEPDYFQ